MCGGKELAGACGGVLPQAKALGDQLVVGLIPDSEILRCKGPPVQDEEERLTLVEAVKWVDEVITGARGWGDSGREAARGGMQCMLARARGVTARPGC